MQGEPSPLHCRTDARNRLQCSERELLVLQEKKQSTISANYYLVSLLLTLLGTLLFLANARGLSWVPWQLLFSILLMTAPTLFYIFYEKCSLSRGQALTLLLIPLFALQYIYYLQAGVPVGFTDPHRHIFTYWTLFDDAGKIIFDNVQQVSFNFVGLYVLFHLISLASSLDIFTLAAAIPPFLNILIIIAVYLAVNRLHEHRTGLLAAMLYGWENMVHILGQEYRTQTMGVLLLFFITALLLILNRKTVRSGIFAVIILLAGLVTTSFVANFYALLVFTGAACAVFIWFLYKREGDWLVINTLSIVLYLAFIVFLVCYLLYVSGGFPYLLAQFSHILYNAAGQALSPEFGTIITKSILLVVLGCAVLVGIGLIYMLIKKITKWRPAGSFCLTAGLVLLLSLGILLYTGHSVAGAASLILFAPNYTPADFENNLSNGDPHRHFNKTRVVYLSSQSKNFSAFALLGTHTAEPIGSLTDNHRHISISFYVVNIGRFPPKPLLCWKRRSYPRHPSLTLNGSHQSSFLTTDKSTCTLFNM